MPRNSVMNFDAGDEHADSVGEFMVDRDIVVSEYRRDFNLFPFI